MRHQYIFSQTPAMALVKFQSTEPGGLSHIVIRIRKLVVLLGMLVATDAASYDTLALRLRDADSIFLTRNLFLLSQSYNIEARNALIIQAKAYPNPVFTANLNAIDPQNDETFHIGPSGQKEFVIEQLLIIGGKRKSSIAIARQNKEIAQAEFNDLLRNLRFEVHAAFFLLDKHRIILSGYDNQLSVLDVLIQSYEQQAVNGNLPIKDVIRLKTVRLRISNNRIQTIADYQDAVRKIQVMLQLTDIPLPVVTEYDFEPFRSVPEFNPLLDSSLRKRPDLELANLNSELAGKLTILQKQLAIPDVLVSAGYDQRGGAFQDQVQLGIAIPLPLWNRNKGNIKAAKYDQLNAETQVAQKKNEIYTEVLNAWASMRGAIQEYDNASRLYTKDFSDVFDGMNDNFRKRNISILEFVDFFEAYNESLADYHRIRTQLALSAEHINYVTASSIY